MTKKKDPDEEEVVTEEEVIAELDETLEVEYPPDVPPVVQKDNIGHVKFEEYAKTGTTRISEPIIITRPTVIQTAGGVSARLTVGWEGRIALDKDGTPYPIAEEVFEENYESMEANNG